MDRTNQLSKFCSEGSYGYKGDFLHMLFAALSSLVGILNIGMK